MQGDKKTPLQNELEELYVSQREGAIALQNMPANKDTLRTTLLKDKQKLEDLKNEALRAKVEETYNPDGRFDGLGAYYNAIQPVKIDAPTINKLENNISGQPSVDNARFGIGLININSSIAGY